MRKSPRLPKYPQNEDQYIGIGISTGKNHRAGSDNILRAPETNTTISTGGGMSRLSELLKKLETLEAEQSIQDGMTVPSVSWMSSSDFENEEARRQEKTRLQELYGADHRVIEFDSIRPDGSTSWKGDPEPTIEQVLASPEYRAAEKAYFEALVGETVNTPSDPTNAYRNAGTPSCDDGGECAQMRTQDDPECNLSFTPAPAPDQPINLDKTPLVEPEIDETDPPARPLVTPPPGSREGWLKEIAPRTPPHMIREPYTDETDPPPGPEKDLGWMFGGGMDDGDPRHKPGKLPGPVKYVMVPISGISGGK